MRSSWEIAVAAYLDKNNMIWDYEFGSFPIIYDYKGESKSGTFTPDFKVEKAAGVFEIWEVKGYWRDDAKVKFDAFSSQYNELNIKLVDKQELTRLGIPLRSKNVRS